MTSWLENVAVQSITGDAEKGGWEASLVALQDTDAIAKWQEVAIPFRFYSQGWDADWRTGLIGHALPSGLDFDFLLSGSRFDVATSNRFLEGMSVQGIGFADQSVVGPGPFNDHQILNMRLGHIVEHILEEHCNISTSTNPEGWVDTSDIDTTDSTRINRYNVRATNNAWSMLQQVARDEFYYIYFDRLNKVHYVQHPMFPTPPAVLPPPVMEFTADFCSGRPTVNIAAVDLVSQVKLKATTDDGDVITSVYPATPGDEGRPSEYTRIRCNDPPPPPFPRLDLLAQRQYGWESRIYTVEWPAPGLCGFFFELMDRVEVTYTGTAANGVAIDWAQKAFWIHRIQMTSGPNYTGQTVFTLEEENV